MAGKRKTSLAELRAVASQAELLRLIARRGRVNTTVFLEALHFDLDSAIERLEAAAHHYTKDKEEKLTNFLAAQLAAAGYNATCETDVRGHTDLKVENVSAQLTWLAEAKLHNSHKSNLEGILQLLTRYASGRHSHSGFLLYIRHKGAAKIFERWRKSILKDRRVKCHGVRSGDRGTIFISDHTLQSGFPMKVRHHAVLMAYDPQDHKKR
jgi:hypothetical protein